MWVFGAIFVTEFSVKSTHIYLDRFYYFSNRVTRLKIMEIKNEAEQATLHSPATFLGIAKSNTIQSSSGQRTSDGAKMFLSSHREIQRNRPNIYKMGFSYMEWKIWFILEKLSLFDNSTVEKEIYPDLRVVSVFFLPSSGGSILQRFTPDNKIRFV